jgi:myo-inositol-1(or 4)-monophosphatase
VSDLAQLLALATEVAHEAGALLLEHSSAAGPDRSVTDSAESKSTRTDMVTMADRQSEQLVVDRIRAARPCDGILAEEGSRVSSESGLVWVVDPLDGTINFLYGFPVWAVSIACQREADDETLAGVVYDPVRNETFSATRGGGAQRDGAPLALGPGPVLGEALVGTGFGYGADRRALQARLLATVLPEVRDIRRAGAAALDLCWVAAGRLDGFYEAGLAPWDLAAGTLIVTEAGGSVEEIEGLVPGVPTLVAAAPGLGGPLGDVLRRAAR